MKGARHGKDYFHSTPLCTEQEKGSNPRNQELFFSQKNISLKVNFFTQVNFRVKIFVCGFFAPHGETTFLPSSSRVLWLKSQSSTGSIYPSSLSSKQDPH